MMRLIGTFSRLEKHKVLVLGDLMLDTYTVGKARRISPEAPVAVVHVQHEEHKAGGAGNVMLNLVSLGMEVVAVGRTGQDIGGERLRNSLARERVNTEGIFIQQGLKTPVKNRIIAESQQVVRIDHEDVVPLPELLEQKMIEALPSLMEGIKVVAISDYGKGTLSRTLLSAAIEVAKARQISVIVDPKGMDFSKYHGATVIKPNFAEAVAASRLSPEASLDKVAEVLLSKTQMEALMVTRSEAGMSLFPQQGKRQDFPVRVKEIKDVTGAGDTVLALLACAMANRLSLAEAAQLSNVAAGIAIERLGCARVTLSELARRLLQHDAENKVFDEEHLFALREALREKPFTLLGVTTTDGHFPQIFSTIRQLACQERDLVVYVRDSTPDEDFVEMLASLREVDFIVLKSATLSDFAQKIDPANVYALEKDQLRKLDCMHALLEV